MLRRQVRLARVFRIIVFFMYGNVLNTYTYHEHWTWIDKYQRAVVRDHEERRHYGNATVIVPFRVVERR